jgi:hypothetical protein
VQSGGLPFVAVVQAADFRPHHDAAGRLHGAFRRRILAKREVRPRPLVVRHVGPKNSTKMPLIKDDDVVQTLAADRPDDAFDVGILPGRAWRGADRREAKPFDGAAEGRVEGRVAVVEEESRGGVVRGRARLPIQVVPLSHLVQARRVQAAIHVALHIVDPAMRRGATIEYPRGETGELVKEVSQETATPSRVTA